MRRDFQRRAAVSILMVLVLIILSFNTVQAQNFYPSEADVWIGYESGSSLRSTALRSASMQVGRADAAGVEFEAVIPGVWGQANSGDTFTSLRLEAESMTVGQAADGADLPVLRWNVEVPAGASVTLEVLDVAQRPVDLATFGLPGELEMIQPESCKCETSPQPSPLAPRPGGEGNEGDVIRVAEEFTLRGRRVVVVEIRPVAVGENGKLLLRGSVRGRLAFGADGNLQNEASGGTGRYLSPDFAALLAEQINLPLAQANLLGAAAEAIRPQGYLIISADTYLPILAPFVQVKREEGYQVTLVGLSQVGNTPGAIRDYVGSAYRNWALPPAYLLLVGAVENGTDSIPAWTGQVSNTVTDLYYGTVDGSDWVPDVLVGRVPLRSVYEVQDWVARAVAFANRSGSESWLRSASFLATCDSSNYLIAENTHNRVIDGMTAPGGFAGSYPTSPQQGGDRLYCISSGANYASVQNALVEGRSLVAYSGHGNKYYWEMGLGATSLAAFSGAAAMPLVLSYACQTGDYFVVNSLGEAWLRDGKALAFVGASADTYWGPDDILEEAMFASLMAQGGGTSLGASLRSGLAAVGQTYTGYGQYYHEVYNVLGDPALRAFAPVTQTMKVNVPDTAVIGLAGYDITVELPVTNHSNGPTGVEVMTVEGNWPVRLDVPATIEAGQTAVIVARVRVPAQAANGEIDTFRFSVVSLRDPKLQAVANFQVMAVRQALWVPMVSK